MNTTEQTICSLIGASLFGKEVKQRPGVDWEDVFREAVAQTIGGIVAAAAPEEVRRDRKLNSYQHIALSIQNLYEQDRLIRLFSDAGIPMVILKGSAAAVYYPQPALRAMGDIDFLVPQERFEASAALMKQNGYVVSHPAEDPKARHIGFRKNDVTFELHHHFSYIDLEMEKYLVQGMKKTETGTVDGHSFPMLPPLENGLVLLAHMRNHLKTGLGLRQVIDWMMYCDRVLDDDFWEGPFQAAAAETGMETLAMTATRMCQMYLGLKEEITWCRGADEGLCARLLDNLFTSGNFNRKQGDGGRIELVATLLRREGLFRYLQRAGEHNWKAYKKHRGLMPLCWVYQIGRYVRQGLKAGRGMKLVEDLRRGNDRAEMLKMLGI